MDWILLITVVILAAVTTLLLRRRQQRRLTLTRHTVRCPENDCGAVVAVHTAPVVAPSRRHVDVIACSLMPATLLAPFARKAYFPDLAPPEPYLAGVERAPRHSENVACSKHCLLVLNAAESRPGAEPIRCTSGTSDALELVRQTQGPAITRLMWFYGGA